PRPPPEIPCCLLLLPCLPRPPPLPSPPDTTPTAPRQPRFGQPRGIVCRTTSARPMDGIPDGSPCNSRQEAIKIVRLGPPLQEAGSWLPHVWNRRKSLDQRHDQPGARGAFPAARPGTPRPGRPRLVDLGAGRHTTWTRRTAARPR